MIHKLGNNRENKVNMFVLLTYTVLLRHVGCVDLCSNFPDE